MDQVRNPGTAATRAGTGTGFRCYSAEALAKLGQVLDTIADETTVVVTRDESFTKDREGEYGSQGR